MKIIGVTGNIGSGKTLVSKYLEEKKAFIINADKIGHTILLKNGMAYFEVIEYFGSTILDSNDNIDRKKLGNIVFSDKEKLEVLTKITHKHIVSIIKGIIKERINKNIDSLIVIDAALLVEANLHNICDYVLLVTSTIDNRIKRIIVRDNISYDLAMKKINSQKTTEELMVYATHIVENNSTISNLYKELQLALEKIL